MASSEVETASVLRSSTLFGVLSNEEIESIAGCVRLERFATGQIGGTPDTHQYRVPLYPFLPAALVIGAFTLVIYSLVQRPAESLYGAVTVLSGIPLYYFWRRRHNLPQHKS